MGNFGHMFMAAIATIFLYCSCCGNEFAEELEDEEDKWPTVGIHVFVRNKQISVPYVLSSLNQIQYQKDRIYLWFQIDSNLNVSEQMIKDWAKSHKAKYSDIIIYTDNITQDLNISMVSPYWAEYRMKHLIELKEKGLNMARKRWVDYAFMMDADVILVEPLTLKTLVKKKLPIVAPMLISDGVYTNFWTAITKKLMYKRSDTYDDIINREVKGCFAVPMVHSAVLIDLRKTRSNRLTYDPDKLKTSDGPEDDISTFASSATKSGSRMHVCNDLVYGFIPVPSGTNPDGLINSTDADQLLNLKMEALKRGIVFVIEPELAKYVKYPRRDRMGLDSIFTINLERRPDRRVLMDYSFMELGIDATLVRAVDGLFIDVMDLKYLGVTLYPKYEDPFHKRPMKGGEVGCFLSHYYIWKEIAKKQIKRSLVLEDDVSFAPFFRQRLMEVLKDLETQDWEFVYIGRKILQDGAEIFVTPRLSLPLYSYWTVGYLINEAGARKLIQAEPLSRMLPVDEFIPIMFDQHPNATWKALFPRRDLKALSVHPVLVSPTHYTGDSGYVSDTEDSPVLPSEGTAEEFRHPVPSL